IRMPKATAAPGLVNANTTTGMSVPRELLPEVPFTTVLDGFDPSSGAVENARRQGVTTLHVLPSRATRISARGAVLRSSGRYVEEMVVKDSSAIKVTLAPLPGQSRMEHMASLRSRFFGLYQRVLKIQEAEDAKKKKAKALPKTLDGKKEERLDAVLKLKPKWSEIRWDDLPLDKISSQDRPLVDLVRGKIPAFVHVDRASDIFKAFELIDSNGLKATLILGRDAYKIVDVLAKRKDLGPVLIDPQLVAWESDEETGKETRRIPPKIFHEKGVKFALQVIETRSGRTPTFLMPGEYRFWHQAARLVSLGIPRDVALRSITLEPARAMGLEHRLGSIEKGKDANIVLFSGDPLDARTWVELVLIEGSVVYKKTDDKDLELILRRPVRPF
ncbi:MAG: amidohydrolase family protein, partial [Planctomycetota bacterium]